MPNISLSYGKTPAYCPKSIIRLTVAMIFPCQVSAKRRNRSCQCARVLTSMHASNPPGKYARGGANRARVDRDGILVLYIAIWLYVAGHECGVERHRIDSRLSLEHSPIQHAAQCSNAFRRVS